MQMSSHLCKEGPSSPGYVSRQTSSPDGATISWGYSGLCTKQQGDRLLSPSQTQFRHHETGRLSLRPLCALLRYDSKRHRGAALSSKLARSPWRASGGSPLIKLVLSESSPAPRTAPSPAFPIRVTVFACSEEADTSTASQSVRNPPALRSAWNVIRHSPVSALHTHSLISSSQSPQGVHPVSLLFCPWRN